MKLPYFLFLSSRSFLGLSQVSPLCKRGVPSIFRVHRNYSPKQTSEQSMMTSLFSGPAACIFSGTTILSMLTMWCLCSLTPFFFSLLSDVCRKVTWLTIFSVSRSPSLSAFWINKLNSCTRIKNAWKYEIIMFFFFIFLYFNLSVFVIIFYIFKLNLSRQTTWKKIIIRFFTT